MPKYTKRIAAKTIPETQEDVEVIGVSVNLTGQTVRVKASGTNGVLIPFADLDAGERQIVEMAAALAENRLGLSPDDLKTEEPETE